jgi:hypothetical protein
LQARKLYESEISLEPGILRAALALVDFLHVGEGHKKDAFSFIDLFKMIGR